MFLIKNLYKSTSCIRIILVFSLISLLLASCATDSTVLTLQGTPQNTYSFLADPKSEYTVSTQAQHKLTQSYLKYYFSPWSKDFVHKLRNETKKEQQKSIKDLLKHPGWNENLQPHSLQWAQKQAANMNLANYPNIDKPGITMADSDIRVFPTVEPTFETRDSPGRSYPFDNFQQSYLPANTPVHVLSTSKNGEWYLVLTPSYSGWIQRTNVALVTPKFIKEWRKQPYIVTTKDDQLISFGKKHTETISTRIGVIYPLIATTHSTYKIKVAVKTDQQYAIIQSAKINKNAAAPFPLKISAKNIATVANEIMGKPYGWGGLYGYRDCSSTMMDIMSTMGIWLPRNSAAQKYRGQVISFKGMGSNEKEKIIKRKGIPFLTLINIPGHVMLYIGTVNGETYVYQTMWGLKTLSAFSKDTGRAVVGSTVITPLRFGGQFLNVRHSILESVDSMTLLVNPHDLNFVN